VDARGARSYGRAVDLGAGNIEPVQQGDVPAAFIRQDDIVALLVRRDSDRHRPGNADSVAERERRDDRAEDNHQGDRHYVAYARPGGTQLALTGRRSDDRSHQGTEDGRWTGIIFFPSLDG